MRTKEGKRTRRILWKFLISYMAILAIPLLIVSFIYMNAADVVEDDARRSNTSMLEQVRDILDRRLDEVNSMVEQIILDKKVNSLLSLGSIDKGSPDNYKIWNVWSQLPDYRITNNFIENYYIFFRETDIVVSPDTTYVEKPRISGKVKVGGGEVIQDSGEDMWGRFYSKFYLPTTSFIVNGKKSSGILYLQSFPTIYRDNPRGLVAVSINRNEVDKLLRNINIGDKGMVAIFDDKDQLISSAHGEKCSLHPEDIRQINNSYVLDSIINRENMIVSTVDSPVNGWSYVSVVPREFVMSNVDHIRNLIIQVALVALIFGLLAAYFLAYRNTKPIRDIVTMTKGMMGNTAFNEGNGYDFIQKTVSQLIKNNENLQEEMENQQVFLRMTFFGRLLNRDFRNKRELEDYLQHTGIQLNGVKHAALILRMDLYEDLISQEILEELDMIRVVIKDLLTSEFKQEIYLHYIDSYRVGVLISYDEDNEAECIRLTEQIITNVQRKIYQDYNLHIVCSGGEICTNILNIGNSFEEAKKALDYKAHVREQGMVWYSQILKDDMGNEMYYYPIDIEMSLMNFMNTGNIDEVDRIIKNLYRENFVKRQLSREMIQQLIYGIRGTILRQSIQNAYIHNVKDIYEGMDTGDGQNPEYFFDNAMKVCMRICQFNTGQKEDSKREFKEKVLEYLDQVYMREDVNLYMVASRFHVTESYMYQFFKEYIGMTFASYLERVRIHQACKLLSQSNIPVKEIASKVGYSNDHTFRRALKRVIGVSPSDYRNISSANGTVDSNV